MEACEQMKNIVIVLKYLLLNCYYLIKYLIMIQSWNLEWWNLKSNLTSFQNDDAPDIIYI